MSVESHDLAAIRRDLQTRRPATVVRRTRVRPVIDGQLVPRRREMSDGGRRLLGVAAITAEGGVLMAVLVGVLRLLITNMAVVVGVAGSLAGAVVVVVIVTALH